MMVHGFMNFFRLIKDNSLSWFNNLTAKPIDDTNFLARQVDNFESSDEENSEVTSLSEDIQDNSTLEPENESTIRKMKR